MAALRERTIAAVANATRELLPPNRMPWLRKYKYMELFRIDGRSENEKGEGEKGPLWLVDACWFIVRIFCEENCSKSYWRQRVYFIVWNAMDPAIVPLWIFLNWTEGEQNLKTTRGKREWFRCSESNSMESELLLSLDFRNYSEWNCSKQNELKCTLLII